MDKKPGTVLFALVQAGMLLGVIATVLGATWAWLYVIALLASICIDLVVSKDR